MPSIVRAIVNSLIPEDKKSKVDFVADADIAPRQVVGHNAPGESAASQAKSMRLMCEPHQLEEQYGGTAPNVAWQNLKGTPSADQEFLLERRGNRFKAQRGDMREEPAHTSDMSFESIQTNLPVSLCSVKCLKVRCGRARPFPSASSPTAAGRRAGVRPRCPRCTTWPRLGSHWLPLGPLEEHTYMSLRAY